MSSLRFAVLTLTAATFPLSSCGYKTVPTPSVVFIGDSITALWAAGPGQEDFGTHPTWISKGVSGQTSGQVLARFKTDVIALHPAAVHILVGTNDVYPGWVLGLSAANVTAMVNTAQAYSIKVVLATIPPWETDPLTYDVAYNADPSQGRYGRIEVWNEWLRQFSAANGLPLADYHKVLQAPNYENYTMTLTLDGVHPSSLGYTVMTPLAEQGIEKALAAQ